jgi:predicted HAD superfamily Cof-like phosphohydrolase
MDSISVISALIEFAKYFTEEEFEKIKENALNEFNKHMIKVQVANDAPLGSMVDVIDGYVDAIYYGLDTLVRCGVDVASVLNDGASDEEHDVLGRQVKEYLCKWHQMVSVFVVQAFGEVEVTDVHGQLKFAFAMILSEVYEAYFTFSDQPNKHINSLTKILGKDHRLDKPIEGDGIMRLMLILVALVERGLSEYREVFVCAFEKIHEANMNKGVEVDGKILFKTLDIGGVKKIVKPAGWQEANLAKEIGLMLLQGQDLEPN